MSLLYHCASWLDLPSIFLTTYWPKILVNKNLLCNVAILAGGEGTRLKVRTGKSPKPMALILGKPVLEYQIELCRFHGFRRIALLVRYEYETIWSYFGDGQKWGVELLYCVERYPRGTAGALADALVNLESRFIVLYGDTYADVDLNAITRSHDESGALGTILLHPNDHPEDSDLVEIDSAMRVVAVHPYPRSIDTLHANLVNAGLYVLQRDALLNVVSTTTASDLAKHAFPAMLRAGMFLHAYVTPEYIKDMGTPERLDKVEHDLRMGVPERLSSRGSRQAIFLDRDGTINAEVHHLRSSGDLKLQAGASDAIRQINSAGILALCVTNQPVVARGDISLDDLKRIHARLEHMLGLGNAYLDGIFVCPHHPDRGFAGEVRELKITCDCRKPSTGLIDRAVLQFNISRRQSWMVGDSTSDIRAGRLAGLRTVLVRTGYAGLDGKFHDQPDYVMPDLHAAVDWILRGHPTMVRKLLPVTSAAFGARLILFAGTGREVTRNAAYVMAEQLNSVGTRAHILSTDAWCDLRDSYPEEGAPLDCCDLQTFVIALKSVLPRGGGHFLHLPPNQHTGRNEKRGTTLSIGQDDVLIVEGLAAMLDPDLRALSDLMVFLGPEEFRTRRATQSDQLPSHCAMDNFEKYSRAVHEAAFYATHYICIE